MIPRKRKTEFISDWEVEVIKNAVRAYIGGPKTEKTTSLVEKLDDADGIRIDFRQRRTVSTPAWHR